MIEIIVIGLVSGFLGALTGSGSLISIPALIFLGFPPQTAIATNRLGTLGRSLGSIPLFWKAKKVDIEMVPILIILSIIASIIGGMALVTLSTELITTVLGIILLCCAPIYAFNKRVDTKRKVSDKMKIIGYTAYFFVMILTTMTGGLGLIVFTIFTFLFGLRIVDAIATDSVPSAILYVLSISIFAYHGLIDYVTGSILFVSMTAGGYIGARTALMKNNQWIKYVIATFIFLAGIKLV